MNHSLFNVLDRENLTRLTINYDWREEQYYLRSAREWDEDVIWSDYNRTFSLSTPLTQDGVFHGHRETMSMFEQYGSADYLLSVIELLRKGKHRFIDCMFCRGKDIRFINNVHSDALGINNRSHAIRAGGIRRHGLQEPEYDVIVDGLNLARSMSYKNFAARIPHGGNKMTVIMEPVDLADLEALGFLSFALDSSRTFTGPDMGFPTELADVMKKHFTINITGGPSGPLGETGRPTAFGTYLAVKEAAQFAFGSSSLAGLKIAVQGLGAVGSRLCEHYVGEGASLVIADINATAVDEVKQRHADAMIEVASPEEILFTDVDILSPCAIGGVLTEEAISRLKCRIVMGGANNQLAASSQSEELALADALARRDILFQVGWWHNLGGVLCGFEEYTRQDDALMDNVLSLVSKICPEYTRKNLHEAHGDGTTPTANAYQRAESAIYSM